MGEQSELGLDLAEMTDGDDVDGPTWWEKVLEQRAERRRRAASDAISTGLPALDEALGGGLARGRIVDIYGPKGSGQPALAAHALRAFSLSGSAAILDSARTYDVDLAQQLGTNFAKVLVSHPTSDELALESAETLARSGAVGLIFVNGTVPSLAPPEDPDDVPLWSVEESARVRWMGHAIRRLGAACAASGATVVFLRTLGRRRADPDIAGNAIKFYAWQRVDVRRRGPLVLAHVSKNKAATPFRSARLRLDRDVDPVHPQDPCAWP